MTKARERAESKMNMRKFYYSIGYRYPRESVTKDLRSKTSVDKSKVWRLKDFGLTH